MPLITDLNILRHMHMAKPLQLKSVLTLAISLLGGALILLVILTVGTAGQQRVTDQVGKSVMLMADQMQDKLDRALYERFREIGNTSEVLERISATDPNGGVRTWLDKLQKGYPDYAWIGLTDATGRVQTATGSILEGTSVATEAWFHDGLKQQTVGDVRESPLLSMSLPRTPSDAHRYVAISAPVVDASGKTIGVLAALLDWAWVDEVRDSLFGTTSSGGSEQVIVLNKTGLVILGPPGLTGHPLELASVRSAVAGVSHYAIEEWPDGRDYVTGIARSDGYRSFSGLGWIVLVRQDAVVALAPVSRLQKQTLAWSLALTALGALAAGLLSQRISAPLLRLSNSADAIRRGDEVNIPDVRDYAEVEALSRSLETLVSELKHRQDALAELNVSLEAQVSERTSELLSRNSALTLAREEAEAATDAKSRFLAAASHDLRQPLHAMTLFARALSRRVSGDEAPRLVEQLELALVSLRGMFDSLLNISRLDAGLIEPVISQVLVREVLERISEAFRAEAEARGLQFKYRAFDATIATDPALLETMLRNLLSNALKFTRSGSILLAAHRRQGRVAFEVWDSGVGIAEEERERIFGEFERTRQDASGQNEGLGLGLSIVKRYARLLDIEIKLSSRLGRGTAFTLLLPANPLELTSPVVSLPVAREDNTTLLQGLHVILIDDDPMILAAMRRELTDRGCTISSIASEADVATAVLQGLRADVAIIDFDLGGDITGIDALKRLEHAQGPIAALILTGGTDAETLAKVLDTGRPWLIKPADPEEVARQLKRLVRSQDLD